jgi:hypothetical protein
VVMAGWCSLLSYGVLHTRALRASSYSKARSQKPLPHGAALRSLCSLAQAGSGLSPIAYRLPTTGATTGPLATGSGEPSTLLTVTVTDARVVARRS